jgi:hypothetical protein
MIKTYGVCAGLLALGLVGLGAPASRAGSRLAAGEAGGGSETAATSTASSTSTPTASSPADLRQRIDALKAELADLNTELAAEKDGDTATSAAAPQDQGTPPAATPAAAPAAAPMPLPTPSMSGPLATGIPHELPAGPFGKIEITGVLSGIGLFGNNPQTYLGDGEGHVDVSNAQIFIQKTSGVFQFFLQGGAYNLPVVGVPFLKTGLTTTATYGPFPVGYAKIGKGNFNVEIGSLPTLIGDEYTFTFQNMDIERGLLWNQEPAISRGIQINDAYKKLTVSFSWNDGFYSDRYTSLSGLLAYAVNAANTVTFAAGGNAGNTYVRPIGPANPTGVTPAFQNNEQVYNLIYTYTKGNVTISPYYQYTVVKSDDAVYLNPGAHTNGGAILANYNFKHGFSLAVRPEYIKSSGSPTTGEANLLGYGSGSGAFSFTVTPTWVKDAFFLRGDFSFVHITDLVSGSGFGTTGANTNQARGAIEAGFTF